MNDEPLVDVASRIADGHAVDWPSMTSTLSTDEERGVAEQLELVARIAAGHRQLHQLLPPTHDGRAEPARDRARWGHLDLLDIVGRGSYGTVYRAWDTRLERLVALKLFHDAPDPTAVMQEGRMLARIRHEHVVTVYGADVIDGVAGIWMEFVHGPTLDQIVKEHGPMAPQEAATIGRGVARALAAIHRAKLLHCDIKAQNVVREAGGRVVLMDLGAGRAIPDAKDDDQISDVAGTPRYMAPELFRAGAVATRATDVYSLGVLLFYLASGRFPVDGKSLGELKQARLEGRVTPLDKARPGLPPGYVALVERSIDADAGRRLASAADVELALAPIAVPVVSRTWPTWAAVALGVGLLALGTWRLTTLSPPVVRIAVLPIKNLTGDASKSYIADGLTEVLISNLARIRSVRVPSFGAVAFLRDNADPPAEVARKLGVELLLAGTITQADPGFRMTVQLIDPKTGAATWGEEISREAPGMVSAQAEIARFVAERLGLALSQAERSALQPSALAPQAQDAYLRGLALRTTLPTARREAARLFRLATELDSTFAAAWAQLALAEVALAAESADIDRKTRSTLARQIAERAIQLDPTLAAGYIALGTIQFYDDWDFDAAERTLQSAVALGPSDGLARQRLSMLLAARGRLQEAIPVAQEAVRVEPLVPLRAVALGGVYYYAGDFDRAEAEARRALQLSPDFPAALYHLGQIAAARKQYDEAIAYVRRALAVSNYVGWLVDLARIHAAAGRVNDANAILAELEERKKAGESYSPDNLAYIAAAEGRVDDAFRILNDAADRHAVNILWIAVDPRVDSLRRDPRFNQLLVKMGLK